MGEATVARLLAAAERWSLARLPDPERSSTGSLPVLIAGWEDADPFCAAVCSSPAGLAFCARCPETAVERTIASRRPVDTRCPAGVRLLAFSAPRGSPSDVVVLRIEAPPPRGLRPVADIVEVPVDALRRASRRAVAPAPADVLQAARTLRDPGGLVAWQVEHRARSAERRRAATAALAEMIERHAGSEDSSRAARREQTELARAERLTDRLARETFQSSDLVRDRLAHQIHDTAAQSMLSAFRFLDAARTQRDGEGGPEPGAPDYLAEASERLLTAIREVRSVLSQLVPPGLELGLVPAIRFRLQALEAEAGIEGHVRGELPRLKGWVEQALYGMTVEAMTNAARHAQAKTIRVEMGATRSRAHVSIRDDGRGFDPAAVQRSSVSGLGLIGIVRQATWLGGRAIIDSVQGEGTTIEISVPLAGFRGPQPQSQPQPRRRSLEPSAVGEERP